MTDAATVVRVGAEFALAGAVESVVPFGSGNINETFLVATAGGAYVVQRINRAVFGDSQPVVENAANVCKHLGGQFVPEPVPTRRAGWLVVAGDDAWRAWKRVGGAETVSAVTPATVWSAANLLGRFHAGLADLEPHRVHETLPDFHAPARRLRMLRDVVAADPRGRVEGVVSEIAAALAAAPLAHLADELVSRVPVRVAHNDAKLDNILFRDGDAVCIVDLDTLMPTAWFWDVGDLLRTASTRAAEDDPSPGTAVVDPALYGSILDGYRAGVSPHASAAEDDALEVAGAIVTFEQAVRFLTDWIAGDVYYRTTRPSHNLDRARAQLALLASMPGTFGA